MQQLRQYLLSLVSCGFIQAIAAAILPVGAGRKIVGILGGLLFLFAALQPLKTLDPDALAEAISKFEIRRIEAASGIEIDQSSIIADIITEKTETYILDKAIESGAQIDEVSAQISNNGDYPHPVSVSLIGRYTAAQRLAISRWITNELAIPEGKQQWIWKKNMDDG